MRKIFLLFAFAFLQLLGHTQNLVMIDHSNGSSNFYSTLDSAFMYLQDGDNVYLSGGIFGTGGNYYLSHQVSLFGTGINSDSSGATGISKVNGILYIENGASNSTIQGIYFQAPANNYSIVFGNEQGIKDTLSNILIKRCLGNIILSQHSTNILISECVLKSGGPSNYYGSCIVGNNVNGFTLEKCFLEGPIMLFNGNSFINNNIFMYVGSGSYAHDIPCVNNTIFNNNVFINDNFPFNGGCGSPSGNVFNNNLFDQNVTSLPIGYNGDVFSNNIVGIQDTAIFTNQSGANWVQSQNYHFRSTCPGKNAGNDGTDISIYGTTNPFKDGSIPYNPHIISKTISGSTDGNGNLNVNIKVAAQKN